MNVSWNAVSGANSYDLSYRVNGNNNWTNINTSNTSYQLSGLTACTSYDLKVRAVCSSGNSNFSSVVNASTSGCSNGCTDHEITLTLTTDDYGDETTWELTDANGSVLHSGGPYQSNTTFTELMCLPSGCYDFTIYDSYGDGICCQWGQGSYAITDVSGNIMASGGQFGYQETTNICPGSGPGSSCQDLYEPNNKWRDAVLIQPWTQINGLIDVATDKDWFKFQTYPGKPNLKIDLSSLPANYDMKLYKGGTLVAVANNNGTADEQIIYNTSSTGTYRIVVKGRNGAHHASDCYELIVRKYASSIRQSDPNILDDTKDLIVKAYPNPAYDFLTVSVQNVNDKPVNIRLVDISGRSVYSEVIKNNGIDTQLQIDVTGFTSGMYLLQIFNGIKQENKRIVINRD